MAGDKSSVSNMKKKQNHWKRHILIILVFLALIGYGLVKGGLIQRITDVEYDPEILEEAGEWKGFPFAYINGNVPEFAEDEIWTSPQEALEPLDSYGRCGKAMACVGQETMPTGERESISDIHPSGWKTDRYDFIPSGYLYNRCHLIGHQLTGDDAIDRNLITGTSYMNRDGMIPFENAVAIYVKETGNHVMYRVTPVFKGSDLVARGLHIEAMSVEDGGKGISFNVFCYNVQPGVEINYSNGKNRLSEDDTLLVLWQEGYLSVYPKLNQKADNSSLKRIEASPEDSQAYVINISSGKFHLDGCTSLKDANIWNLKKTFTSREDLLARGYEPCRKCRP